MKTAKRLIPLAVLVAVLLLAWALGLQHQLSWAALAAHQSDLRALVAAHPVLAPMGFVLIYIVCTSLSLPTGIFLSVSGGWLFGPLIGGPCAAVGATIGAGVLFLAARYALADMLAARAGRLLDRIRPGLERDGFSYLLALRLIPACPFWLVNLAAALAGMAFLPFITATFIGIIPASIVFASVGGGLGDVIAAGGHPDASVVFSAPVLLPLLGLAALALLPVAWRRWKTVDA